MCIRVLEISVHVVAQESGKARFVCQEHVREEYEPLTLILPYSVYPGGIQHFNTFILLYIEQGGTTFNVPPWPEK